MAKLRQHVSWGFGLAILGVIVLLLSLPHATRWWLELPQFSHGVGEVMHVSVPMNDGVGLSTSVSLPAGEGPWPAVLIRSPYNPIGSNYRLCELMSRYGFACVYQDVRGRGDSEGEWVPMVHEREDGLATLRWILEQPWQNRKLAMVGMSYMAAVQWALADAAPPEVKTLVPMVFGTDVYGLSYRDGMFRHEVVTAWAASMPGREVRFDHGDEYQDAVRHRPFAEVDERYFGRLLPWYRDLIHHPARSAEPWQTDAVRAMRTIPERAKMPMLVMGAWFDFSAGDTIDSFNRLQTKEASKLVVGPWDHLQTLAGDLKIENNRGPGKQIDIVLDWLQHHLKGEPLRYAPSGVETFAMGLDRWHHWSEWPPPTEAKVFHLDHLEQSNACAGGTLADRVPRSVTSITFRYDPSDPVPGRGGAQLLAFALPGFGGVRPGPVDQEGLCEREDVLTFVSEPLLGGALVAGPISVNLQVRSTAPDTAFTAKVMQVDPEGRAFNIRESITSLRFRNGAAEPQPYTPGEVVELHIELEPIEWYLAPGYRLRLDVSSSSFPVFHAHANTLEPWATAVEARVAEQTLVAGSVALPVWGGGTHVVARP